MTNEYPLSKYFVAFLYSTSVYVCMHVSVCVLLQSPVCTNAQRQNALLFHCKYLYFTQPKAHKHKNATKTTTTCGMAQLQATRCEVNAHSLTQNALWEGCVKGKTLNITCCNICKYSGAAKRKDIYSNNNANEIVVYENIHTYIHTPLHMLLPIGISIAWPRCFMCHRQSVK